MHDIDRTQAEYDAPGEMEFEGPEGYELEEPGEVEGNGEFEFENSLDPGEAEILELAAELMQTQDEAELEAFLGDFLKKKLKKLRRHLPGLKTSLGGILKSAFKQAVPALGASLGGPMGGLVARKLQDAASGALGLELEGLSPEDKEFEVAKQLMRFANQAAKTAVNLANSSPGSIGGGVEVAKRAIADAATKYAPGFVGAARRLLSSKAPRAAQGRWKRVPEGILLFEA